MDILYICNEKMLSTYNIEAIFNKICIDDIDPYVACVLIYSKAFDGLKNNVFLLLDNIRKIKALKFFI